MKLKLCQEKIDLNNFKLQRVFSFTDQVEGKYEESLKRAQKCLTYVQGLNESDLSNYKEITANLYSCIGNAYLELGNYKKALIFHNKDLDSANDK